MDLSTLSSAASRHGPPVAFLAVVGVYMFVALVAFYRATQAQWVYLAHHRRTHDSDVQLLGEQLGRFLRNPAKGYWETARSSGYAANATFVPQEDPELERERHAVVRRMIIAAAVGGDSCSW